MDNSLLDQVRSCGWPAYPTLLFGGLALTSSSLVMFLAVMRRRYARVFAAVGVVLALLPMASGLIGTFVGRAAVQRALPAVDPSMQPQLLQQGYREALMCSEIGVASGLFPLMLAVGALVLALFMPAQAASAGDYDREPPVG